MGKMFLRDPLTYPSEKLKYLKKKKQQSVLDDIRNVNKISVYNYTSLEKSRGSDDLLNSLHASFSILLGMNLFQRSNACRMTREKMADFNFATNILFEKRKKEKKNRRFFEKSVEQTLVIFFFE